ncbi:MAG: hypothetical protein ACMXYC_02380 [Candidatus Woesearchaeota archaeon]
MNTLMSWKECERSFVRKVSVDMPRIDSLKKSALLRLHRAEHPFEGNLSFALEDYYEAIKELLVAYMLLCGYSSSNHQCLISFFYQQHKEYEFEALLIQRMSLYRNRLGYYGEQVDNAFVTTHIKEFRRIITLLDTLVSTNSGHVSTNSGQGGSV